MLKWLKHLFHIHKWKTIWSVAGTASLRVWPYKSERVPVRKMLQKCTICGKQRAYITDGMNNRVDLEIDVLIEYERD